MKNPYQVIKLFQTFQNKIYQPQDTFGWNDWTTLPLLEMAFWSAGSRYKSQSNSNFHIATSLKVTCNYFIFILFFLFIY